MYKKIKILCAKSGWKMSDVAKELDISESYLYKLISGDRHSEKQIKKITDLIYTDIPVSSFKSYVLSTCREKDLPLHELADRLDISLPYLYDVLNGRRRGERIKRKIKVILEE